MADSTQPGESSKEAARKAKRREYAKLYYARNKERIDKKNRAWIAANKERHKALCRANRVSNKEKERVRTKKWKVENPEKVRATQKRYREKNKEILQLRREQSRDEQRAYSMEHYRKNKDRYRARRQEYRKANREKLRAAGHAYYEKNKGKVLERHRLNRESSRESTRERNREYQKQKWREDFEYWLKKTVSRRMRDALTCQATKKSERTLKLIGCSASQLAIHLEAKFLPGMSWDNYGYRGWHIDHIVPIAKFDLGDPLQQAAAFHYTNLQPLWAKDNIRKGAKILGQRHFGFALAARIAEGTEQKPKRKRLASGRQHIDH